MPTTLKSHLCGSWQSGDGLPSALHNPSTEEVIAQASTSGLDFAKAVAFARAEGGAQLRKKSFAERAELLRTLAKIVSDAREELIAVGISNAGNTRSDAKFDIDGAAATLLFYAELGQTLGDRTTLADGEGIPIGRSARLYGQHLLVPRHGVAVHINAFNFPAWGMAEKLAAAVLAGMPVITKPATATAVMAHRIAELWTAAGVLPAGAFSFVAGGVGDLLSQLGGQDVVAFTGSGVTAASIRRLENLATHNVHVNVEADSLNPVVLGPDVQPGSETWNVFLTEVTKEITQKTGQKCTATRRVFVAPAQLDEVKDALADRLKEVRVGNPEDEKVTMGPLATAHQLKDVLAGIEALRAKAEVVVGGATRVDGLGAPAGKGYFVAPTLLLAKEPSPMDPANGREVFGPVCTLMPYASREALETLVAAGGGGLVASVYSDDRAFVAQTVTALAPFHGRITLVNEKLAGQSVPPGTVLPGLLHGGPGRAGGGEELGGLRGMSLYLQRVALQGHRAQLEQLTPPKA